VLLPSVFMVSSSMYNPVVLEVLVVLVLEVALVAWAVVAPLACECR